MALTRNNVQNCVQHGVHACKGSQRQKDHQDFQGSGRATGLQYVRPFQKPSHWVAEVGRSLLSRPAWSTSVLQSSQSYVVRPYLKQQTKKTTAEGRRKERREGGNKLPKKTMKAPTKLLHPPEFISLKKKKKSFLNLFQFFKNTLRGNNCNQGWP